MSELGGEDVKRFHWSSHLTRTSESLNKVGKKMVIQKNLSLRSILELIGINQTRNFKSRKDLVLRLLWKDNYKLVD